MSFVNFCINPLNNSRNKPLNLWPTSDHSSDFFSRCGARRCIWCISGSTSDGWSMGTLRRGRRVASVASHSSGPRCVQSNAARHSHRIALTVQPIPATPHSCCKTETDTDRTGQTWRSRMVDFVPRLLWYLPGFCLWGVLWSFLR